jgi:predicted nucleic acid-binding protein
VTRWVVDAGVALKWCFSAEDEIYALPAEELLACYERREAECLVPDLFWPELANGLGKAVGKRKIDRARAEKSYAEVVALGFPTIPSFALLPEAFQLAVAYGSTVYDSLYIALAIDCEAELITADERLANALAAHLPVKWLGALTF